MHVAKDRHCPQELPVYPDGINEQGMWTWAQVKTQPRSCRAESNSSAPSKVAELHRCCTKRARHIRQGMTVANMLSTGPCQLACRK